MAFGIQQFGVTLPVVGVEVSHATGGQLAAQLLTTGIGAASQNKGGNRPGVTVEAIPQPALLLFVLHKTPLFIHFQSQNAWRNTWFGRLGRRFPHNGQHRSPAP